jgi:hypothetical protein
LYEPTSNDRVGHNAAQLTLIRRVGKKGFQCVVPRRSHLSAGGGKIEAAGFSTFRKLRQGAAFTVTGGTGAYEGARGMLTVREENYRTYFTFSLNP